MSGVYRHIFQTYRMRRMFWWLGVAVVGISAIVASNGLVAHTDAIFIQFCVVIGLMLFIGACVTSHVKLQIADPRGVLVPGFRRPHLIAAGRVAATFMLLPLISSLLLGVDALAAISLSLLALAVGAIVGYTASGGIVLFIVIAYFAGWDLIGRERETAFLLGQNPAAAVVFLAVGVLGLAWVVRLLWILREDMPAYRRHLYVDPNDTAAVWRNRSADPNRLTFMERLVYPADLTGRAFGMPAPSMLDRVRRAMAPNLVRQMTLILGVGLALYVVMLSRKVPATVHRHALAWPVAVMFMLPAVTNVGAWRRRWQMLAMELLHPASRHQFIRDTGAAYLAQAAILILTAGVAWGIPVAVFLPAYFEHQPVLMMAMFASAQLLCVAWGAWVLRYRSALVVMVLATLPVMVLGPLLLYAWMQSAQQGWIHLPLVVLSIAAAAGILADAYRRWLRTELG